MFLQAGSGEWRECLGRGVGQEAVVEKVQLVELAVQERPACAGGPVEWIGGMYGQVRARTVSIR